MIKIENVVLPSPEQWEATIRGMRNPKNSWDRSDSGMGCVERKYINVTETGLKLCDDCLANWPDCSCTCVGDEEYYIGPKDHHLMETLNAGGPVHAKYRRMIPVYLDITAPLYWWKEFDTYKVGTVTNSCSTMHKIHAKEFTREDFSMEHLINVSDDPECTIPVFYNKCDPYDVFWLTISQLNVCRKKYLETKDKKYWWQMIQLLPSSYNQKRTVMLNYEVLVGIYKWRKDHKLDEWRVFCEWIESLPYSELITGKKTYNEKTRRFLDYNGVLNKDAE